MFNDLFSEALIRPMATPLNTSPRYRALSNRYILETIFFVLYREDQKALVDVALTAKNWTDVALDVIWHRYESELILPPHMRMIYPNGHAEPDILLVHGVRIPFNVRPVTTIHGICLNIVFALCRCVLLHPS